MITDRSQTLAPRANSYDDRTTKVPKTSKQNNSETVINSNDE